MKKVTYKPKPTISKNNVQRPGPSKAPVAPAQENKENALTEALQANAAEAGEESHSISPSDFEANVEPAMRPQRHLKEESDTEETVAQEIAISPGEAERVRLLAEIRQRFSLVGDKTFIVSKPDETMIKELNKFNKDETNMNEQVREIKERLAQANKPEFPKMTVEHYKSLKEMQPIADRFRVHGVLTGVSNYELDKMLKAMHEVFEPTYKFDAWCSWCIGEFVNDLYTYFDRWKEQQKEAVSDYETLVKHDTFKA